MRQTGVTLLRPLLRGLSSQSTCGRDRILQSAVFRGRGQSHCTKHFRVRWLSTLGVVELDHAGTSKTPRQALSDVQHVSINQQFEHDYETILCYPRGISTCSEEELVFISDSLHDRIIIADGSGGVFDYIGSIAGFEDGPFDSARLRRPSSIVYDTEQKCLYIADCENHAIRRADLSSRMLDTVYPKQDKGQGLIQRWLRGLGFMQGSSQRDEKASIEHQISYPWHLSIVPSGHIIAATQGFEKMWTIEVDTGALTVEPDQEPATIFKKLMESKSAELKESSVDWIHVHETLVSKGFACEGLSNLVSQVAVLKREALLVDAGMHQVLRLDLSTGHFSTMQLSNLALLGVPAWWSPDDDPQVASSLERLHHYRPQEVITTLEVQPGRCLIKIDVALPGGTVLAEPLTDDCIWRQGRGSLVELSTFDGELVNQKVTVAQQYLDDLYKLEGTIEGEFEEEISEDMAVLQQSPSGFPFYSTVDVSLGSGEVVFDAVLYLKRESSAGSDSIPGSFHSGDSHIGRPKKAFHCGLLVGMAHAGLDHYLLRGKIPHTLQHGAPDHKATEPSSKRKPIPYPKPDGVISLDLLTSLYRSSTNHEHDQPSHLHLRDPQVPESVNLPEYAGLESRYCPARVYEYVADENDKLKLNINAQNCLHCKACDVKDPTQNIRWTVQEVGGVQITQ